VPKKVDCPCCGHLTLSERGGFEICEVCFWEDDGQDDVDAHVERGGPNAGTLWQARTSFLVRGSCDEVSVESVRPPGPGELQVRRWDLVDGVAVELIPSHDVAPWNVLHDGSIARLERRGENLRAVVSCDYLRTRFPEPGQAFWLELVHCSEIVCTPNHAPPTRDLAEIGAIAPWILSAETEDDGRVLVWGGESVTHLRYDYLALRLDSGTPLSMVALGEIARQFWAESRNRKTPTSPAR
jgi:hypothetical protein